MVIATVHCRAHQVVKAGVNQHEVTAAHLFHTAHLRHQHAGLGHQEASWLNLQFHRVPQMGRDLLPGAVPQAIIVGGVDGLFTFAVRNRQTAPAEMACRSWPKSTTWRTIAPHTCSR